MLQQIGDTLKGHKWLTYVVFGALTLLFSAWGAYGIANLSFGGGNYVAKVNGQTIPFEDVRRAWQRQEQEWSQRFGGDIPSGTRTMLQDQLLESYIRTTLMTDRARSLGYRVTEQELASAVQAESAFQIDGKYNADVARARLQQAGITEAAYEADLRSGLEASQVENGMRVSQFLTPAEVTRLQQLQGQQRQLRWATLPLERYEQAAKIDDAAVQAYYDAHKSAFLTPETVHLQYAQITLDEVAAQISVPDADLHAYYDKNKAHYTTNEQRHAHHILIAVSAKQNDAAALKKAQDLYAKAKAGADFEQLAKQNSDDTGSAAQGGDLGFVEHASFDSDKPFGDALFALKAGDISPPVKDDFGYHVIRLDSVEVPKGKTFDEARADIESQLKHERATDKFGDLQEKIQAGLDTGTSDLGAIAKQFGLTAGDIPDFARGAGGGDLGNAKEVQDAVFSDAVLNEHRIGGPVVVGDSKLVLVRALDHKAPAPKALADVRDAIVTTLRKDEGAKAAQAAGEEAVKKLQAGADFDAVVKDLDLKSDPARFVGRTDPSVPASVRDPAFRAPKPAQGKAVYEAVAQPTGVLLLAVLAAKTEAPTPDSAQELEQQARQLASQLGTDDAEAYLTTARKAAKVEKNLALFDQQ